MAKEAQYNDSATVLSCIGKAHKLKEVTKHRREFDVKHKQNMLTLL